MKKNKALAVPFVLWAVLFIAVPLAMVVWYGVTVEETPAYVEVAGDNGQTLFQLEDGTVTAERPQKQTVVSLANFRRMLEPAAAFAQDRAVHHDHLPAAGLSRRADPQWQGF